MATEYPDIIGEYIDANKRFEIDGLQYVGAFDPPKIKLGEASNLLLYLQNTLNVPLNIEVRLNVPQTGRFKSHPLFSLKNAEISLTLQEAEVGVLVIPIATTDKIIPGTHQLGVEFKVQHSKNAQEIRHPKENSTLKALPFYGLAGLNLVGVLGAPYSVQSSRKAKFSIHIENEAGQTTPDADADYAYHKLWDVDMSHSQHKAQIEINQMRAQIIEDLAVEPLFVALYAENKRRFKDTGMPLRAGEAIALAKLLTYTAHLFLSQADLQDGLLCPIWERALAYDLVTTNIIQTIKVAGYQHILRLSTVLSFGLIAQGYGKQPWSREEQQGVTDYLVNTLEQGMPLELDFMYLPLMMGAVRVIRQVRLPEEDLSHTMALVQMARQARTDLFADPDMEEAGHIFDILLQKAMG